MFTFVISEQLKMEFVFYTIPSVVVLLGVFFIVNRFLQEESNRLNIMLRQSIAKENQKISLPIRYQAYERLTLLLERMHPLQIVARNAASNISAKAYADQLAVEIDTEFQYNLSQQIYVSADIWQLILQVKMQIKVLLYEIAENLPETATAYDYTLAINKYLEETPQDKIPVYVGLKYLKNEVAQMH